MGGKFWTSEQDEKLRLLYPTTKIQVLCEIFGSSRGRVHARANKLGLKKIQFFTTTSEKSKATQFKKGMTSWNKGLKLGSDWGKRTQFKKGQEPHNKLPAELKELADLKNRLIKNAKEKLKRYEKK